MVDLILLCLTIVLVVGVLYLSTRPPGGDDDFPGGPYRYA